MDSSADTDRRYDILIAGGGPAGLSAAVNAYARNLSAVVFDTRDLVGKVAMHPEVANCLGFQTLPGSELAARFREHFARTGFPVHRELVMQIIPQDGFFMASTGKNVYEARSVILTVGVAQTKVLPGEEEFLGRGVGYCVTCDGAFFRGKDVVVVGYIPEGEEEANVLAGFARSVKYVAAYEPVSMLSDSVELVRAKPTAIEGDTQARVLKTDSGDLAADGIFILREAVPAGTLISGLQISDGFIQVDRAMATSIPGVFAAGDCTGPPYQIAKAVGEGQVAALSAARHLHGSGKAKA